MPAEICPLPTYDCSCNGTYCRLLGRNLEPARQQTVRDLCKHEWSRRRDGRACHKCGEIEFGVSAVPGGDS